MTIDNRRPSGLFKASRSQLAAVALVANIGVLAVIGLTTLPTWAQQTTSVVTPDSAASSGQRPTIGTTANGRVQVDITRPGTGGISVNRYQSFQVGRDGVVLNNSAVDGDSRIGGRVRGNPNLTGGAANVIVNQVRTATGSRLEGPVEVHGTTADVIVADPKGVTCDGCSFVNTRTGVLTSGSTSVSGDKVRIDNRSGTVSIGRGGVDADGNALLTGRRVVIDGPVRAANQLTVSGGTSIVDDVVGNGLAGGVASTTTNGTSAPYAVDATAFGAMEAGSIRIIGHDSSFGVRAIGDITARGSISIRSEADTIVKNVRAPGAIDISARQRTRIYGNVGTTTPRTRAATSTTLADPYAPTTLPASVVLSDVSIRGNEVYIPGGRAVEATRDVLIESQSKAVVGAEVIGRNITIRAGDLLANTGFLAATQALSVDAGAISNQREKLIVYEGQDWADAWLKAYEGVFAEWGTGADPNAVYWGNEYLNWTQTRIVDEYLLAGGSITARDVTLKATAADIANNAGSIAATRDARIEAERDVLNTPVSTLLTRADENCDQTVTVCGQRTVWRGSDLVAGRDLTVIAGRDLVNRASLIGAGRNASITATGSIIADAFISEHAAKLYRKIVDAPNDVTYFRDDWNNVTAALRDIGDVWETDNGNRAVIANARFIALNGDLRVNAGGDLLSIGAEFSAGATARLRAGGTMRLASLVDVNSREYTKTQRVVSTSQDRQWEGNSDNGGYVTYTTYSAVDGILETRVYSDVKAALSTVVGASVDIEAERINILGGRLLASGDLTVASRSGSIVVDSALSVLPSDERILRPNFAAWDALNSLGTTIPLAPAADATDAEKAAFATYLAYERMLRDNPDYRMLTRLAALRDGWSLFSYADDIGARPTYTEIELSPAFDKAAFQAWVGDATQPSHRAAYSAAITLLQAGNPSLLNALMAQFMRAPRLPKFAMRDGKQNLTDAVLDRQTGTANLMKTADVSVAMRNAMAARFVLDTGERSLGGSTRTLLVAHGALTLENRLAATAADPAPVGSGDIILAGGTIGTAGGAIRVDADRDLVLLSLAGTGLADGSDLLSRQDDFRAGLMWRIPDLAAKPADWVPSETDWQSATITSVPATALIGDDGVTLAAGRDFASFGGSVTAKRDLIVSARRDVRNDAIRYNYILTADDGCIGGACGQYGHDYRGAELLSGRGLIVSAGRDVVNGGSQIAGAGSVLVEAGNDIVNEAISSQFLSTYVYKKGWFSKKVIVEYTGVMQDSVIASEFGTISLRAGRDIINEGSTLSSGGALSLDAGRDVQLFANTQELHNVYKNRGFSGLGYGMRKVQWNNFVTAYSSLEATSIAITADRDFKAIGTKIASSEDLSIAALRDLTFDAQQNEYYRRESGWWIGFQAPLFDMIGAIARGDGAALLQQYASQNPFLAAVHDLATGRSRGVSGALSLALGSLRTLDAAGKAAMGPPTLTDGLVQQFNMSKTLGFDPMQLLSGNTSGFTSAAAGCVSDPKSCTFLGGVSLRFTAWSSQRTWTETTVSRVLAGRDMSLSAGQDAALVGGTVVSAGQDLTIVAGRNLGLAAVADNTRTRSWSWGLTFTIGQNGVSVGADGSRSLANSTIFSNAQASAVGDAVFVAGQDINFSGANVVARTILIDAGRDLIVASKQNISSNDSFSISASVSFSSSGPGGSFSGSFQNGRRVYTDTPTTIVADEDLTIKVGRLTLLAGAGMWSKTDRLSLDTGEFVFDNYTDKDRQQGGNVNVSLTASHPMGASFGFGANYSNTVGLTYATLGAGNLNVRDRPLLDISTLNRVPTSMQRVIRREGWSFQIPTFNWLELNTTLQGAGRYINALTADIPNDVREQGAQAVDLYQDAIVAGLSGSALQSYLASQDYSEHLARRQLWEEMLRKGENPLKVARIAYLIANGEAVYFDTSDQKYKIRTECSTSGPTVCGVDIDRVPLTRDHVLSFVRTTLDKITGPLQSWDQDKINSAYQCAMTWAFAGGAGSFEAMNLISAKLEGSRQFFPMQTAMLDAMREYRLTYGDAPIDLRGGTASTPPELRVAFFERAMGELRRGRDYLNGNSGPGRAFISAQMLYLLKLLPRLGADQATLSEASLILRDVDDLVRISGVGVVQGTPYDTLLNQIWQEQNPGTALAVEFGAAVIGGVGGTNLGARSFFTRIKSFELSFNLKTLKFYRAETVNETHLLQYPGYSPPWTPRTSILEVEQAIDEVYARVITVDSANPNLPGSWIMPYREIIGLSPQQIADRFALPRVPTHVMDVNVQAGTRMLIGEANGILGYRGGGTQVQLITKIDRSSFNRLRPIETSGAVR